MTAPHHQLLLALGAPPYPDGILGWWDATSSGDYTFSSGTNINTWLDKSGNGRTMTWAGFGRPTRIATGFNTSYPCTMFDTAVGSAMEATSFPMGTGNEITVWLVGTKGDFTSNSNARIMSYMGSGDTNDLTSSVGSWCIPFTNPGVNYFSRNNTSVTNGGGANYPGGNRYIFTVNSSGVMTPYLDGVAGTTATVSGNWKTNGTLDFGRSAQNSLGFAGNYWTGPMAECGIATSCLPPSSVVALDRLLKLKWGL